MGNYDVTKKLLQSGARTELIHLIIRLQRRAHGRLASLIIWVIAIEINRADIVKLLVVHGSDMHDGITSIMML